MSEIADVDQDLKTIMSQTNYNASEAEEKYNQWNGDYISVIKEYLNPNFQNKKVDTKKNTVNQQMMIEIRNFIDDVNTKYDQRVAKKKRSGSRSIFKTVRNYY